MRIKSTSLYLRIELPFGIDTSRVHQRAPFALEARHRRVKELELIVETLAPERLCYIACQTEVHKR